MYCQYIRHYFLYIPGIIGLTLRFLLSLCDSLEQLGQSQQIPYPKDGSTGSKDHTGIGRGKAGPSRREDPHMIRSFVEADTIFSPTVAVIEDLKLLAVQGMEGVGDGENSFRERRRRCS